MKKITATLLLFTAGISECFSQNLHFQKNEIGSSVSIHSKILNESRELLIYSPKQANDRRIKFPFIYLLDAEALFLMTVSAVKFMNGGSSMPRMPEAYIVGLVNTNRSRDMPVPQEIDKTNGASNFYDFITREIIPYINKNYTTGGLNILAGHSQGALFATYAALRDPKLFQFVIAMDAPIEVSKSVEQLYAKNFPESCGLKYASIKSLYGWSNNFKVENSCVHFKQVTLENETHETMPYKGIYEGLKYLFNDYLPPVKDWPLQNFKDYYNTLAKKYQVEYPIPSSVLLESAKQNIAQLEKAKAMELISENNSLYGPGELSQQLLKKADAIINLPDKRISFSLSQPPPDEEAIKPFLGIWKGTIKVPGGTDVDIQWEIKKLNGKYRMESEIMRQFKLIADFLYINENQELVWGRKHEGGGIYISIGRLSDKGILLTGTEDLIGFDFPAGMPAFKLNTFEFRKQ